MINPRDFHVLESILRAYIYRIKSFDIYIVNLIEILTHLFERKRSHESFVNYYGMLLY